MAAGEETTIVLADASVVVNLAIVDRLDLCGALPGLRFLVPEEVVAEVQQQRELLAQALAAGHLGRVALSGIQVLEHLSQLRRQLGRGEAACLALASDRGWSVASDERRWFRREALRLLGGERLLTTPDLFELGIHHLYWTVSQADEAKEVLEGNRFRMRFGSFHQRTPREER